MPFGDDLNLLTVNIPTAHGSILDRSIGAVICPPVPAFHGATKEENTCRYLSTTFRKTGLRRTWPINIGFISSIARAVSSLRLPSRFFGGFNFELPPTRDQQ